MVSNEGSAPNLLWKQSAEMSESLLVLLRVLEKAVRKRPRLPGLVPQILQSTAQEQDTRNSSRAFPGTPEETEMLICTFKETTFIKKQGTRGQHFPFYYSK